MWIDLNVQWSPVMWPSWQSDHLTNQTTFWPFHFSFLRPHLLNKVTTLLIWPILARPKSDTIIKVPLYSDYMQITWHITFVQYISSVYIWKTIFWIVLHCHFPGSHFPTHPLLQKIVKYMITWVIWYVQILFINSLYKIYKRRFLEDKISVD